MNYYSSNDPFLLPEERKLALMIEDLQEKNRKSGISLENGNWFGPGDLIQEDIEGYKNNLEIIKSLALQIEESIKRPFDPIIDGKRGRIYCKDYTPKFSSGYRVFFHR